MTERPFIWHAGRFGDDCSNYVSPWTVSLGKPKNADDFERVAETLPEAMAIAISMVPREVP